jgi:hypothetical protein
VPAPLGEYARQGGLALGCDPAYVALPVLAVAAGLIGHTRVLRLKRTWRVPAVLWALVVADSGSLKTPAWRLATDYLFVLQRRLDKQFQEDMADFEQEMEAYTRRAKEAKEKGEDPGPRPERPVHRTVFTSDATIEAVAELIEDNPRGLVVSCDELAGWMGSFARYKSKGAGSDLQRWLSMHSAGGFAYHRKTGDRRRIVVAHAAVSVCGGIQPGILARTLGDEFLAAGLAARLLLAMPPRPVKVWTEAEVDPDTEAAYQRTLDALLALKFGYAPDGSRAPHALHLSVDAKARWVAWYTNWAREQAASEGELAAAFAKLEEAAARFALVHHVVTHIGLDVDDRREVGIKSVEAGVALALWFAGEARRVYAMLTETDEEREARRLVEFVGGRGGMITVKDLQMSNAKKYPRADLAELALEGLVQAGLAEWRQRPHSPAGGRPTRDCFLTPAAGVQPNETPGFPEIGEVSLGWTPGGDLDDGHGDAYELPEDQT